MAVIGFLTYSDFLHELAAQVSGQDKVIRVQNYHKTVASENLPITHYQFFITAAVETGRGDTLVCHFLTGRVQYIAGQDGIRIAHYERRNEQAEAILAADLVDRGYTVRPGLIAGSESSKTLAQPGNLFAGLKEVE